ncbi:MAG: hypothetical protein ABJP34_05460 [Erythrobacter sp.]
MTLRRELTNMPQSDAKLLIVYNADTGMINAVLHAMHKALKPETYPCSLCALTYGTVSMHGVWRRFLDALPLDVAFYHRDDYAEDFPEDQPQLPAILLQKAGEVPAVLIPASKLDAMASLDVLMGSLEEKLVDQIGTRALPA